MDKSASRFALKLRELGFERVEGADKEYHVRTTTARIERTLGKSSRHERRKLRSLILRMLKEQPSYTVTVFRDGTALTEASDDTGQMWKAEGNIDLRPFGFLNNAEWIINHHKAKASTVH
ncbi:hypothetical protein EXS62_00235 [Candidatus Kaiserbacteria bacterium]|nr:hypothetical protein [Candidatus Kaiserbacteria bacterium]